MKAIDSALHHVVAPPEGSIAPLHPTLLLLHGRGADEEDLLGLAPVLDKRFLIISARAPYPFAYGGGFTWYDADQVGNPDPATFKSSFEKLTLFTGDVLAGYPVDPQQFYVLGFSMGTAMSLSLALAKPGQFRGIVANSGYIPERTHLTYQWNNLTGTDFFVAHGTVDPVIPIQFARRTRELLEAAGARIEYHEYPMGHEISEESLRDSSVWLTKRLDAAQGGAGRARE